MGWQTLGRGGSVRGPPRGTQIHARIKRHREATRIRNGSADPARRHKCWRRRRREVTPDTVARRNSAHVTDRCCTRDILDFVEERFNDKDTGENRYKDISSAKTSESLG
jgi:hypothetical protein